MTLKHYDFTMKRNRKTFDRQ